jgi:ribose transport system substrate-binding protein
MTLSRVFRFLTVAAVLVALPACGGGSKKPKVAFVSNNPADFWTIADAGCQKAAQEEGVEIVFKKPAQGDAAVQKEVLDALLGQDIKAVAVSVIKPDDQTPYLDEIAAKMPLLAVDNDAPKSKRLAYIGTDNYKAGRAAGKLVKEALPRGGIVVIFVGDLAPINARQRRQGVIDELAGRPARKDPTAVTATEDEGQLLDGKYKLFRKTYTDQPEAEQRALQNAVDAINEVRKELQAGKEMCMVGLWAYNPAQCVGALRDVIDKEKNKPDDQKVAPRIKIVGFDENFDTLRGIEDGLVHATVVQQPFRFGYESVKIMAALTKGDKSTLPKDGIMHIPYRMVTKSARDPLDKDEPRCEAVAEFTAELNKLLGK